MLSKVKVYVVLLSMALRMRRNTWPDRTCEMLTPQEQSLHNPNFKKFQLMLVPRWDTGAASEGLCLG